MKERVREKVCVGVREREKEKVLARERCGESEND
jgi:hypothetical protein